MNLTELTLTIITTLLTFSLPFLLFKIKRQNSELASIKEKLYDKKFNSYTAIFDLFFNLFQEHLSSSEEDEKLVHELIEIQKTFIIYASDDVLQKYIEWKSANGKFTLGHLIPLLEIFPLIRKDMGNKDTTLTAKDILKILMSNVDIEEFYQKSLDEYQGKVTIDQKGNILKRNK